MKQPATHGRKSKQKPKKHMPRLKKTTSKMIQNAAARAAGMESINATLDFGNNLTLAAYKAAITDAQAKQSNYNTLLSQVDEAKNVFQAAEATVGDLSDRMLAAAAARFGRDSAEYEQAGGTRKSERKRRAAPAGAEASGRAA